MNLSIVIPIYNEEESIVPLFKAITKAVKPLLLEYEIILVDDGSKDRSFDIAFEFAKENPELKIVQLNRNYGQSTALNVGIENAKGKFIVTMDGDLQNDPEDIKRLLIKLSEGYDIVFGWRKNRKDNLFFRKIPSIVANALIRLITGTGIKDLGCAMRICRSEVIKKIDIYSDMHRYLPIIAFLAGAKITQIEVKHHSRKLGKSKYGLSRIYKVLLDLVAVKTIWTGFNQPLFGFGKGAIIFAIISLVVFLISIVLLSLNLCETIIIYLGISLLFGALSLFFLANGFICELAYRNSNVKIKILQFTTEGIEIIYNESKSS